MTESPAVCFTPLGPFEKEKDMETAKRTDRSGHLAGAELRDFLFDFLIELPFRYPSEVASDGSTGALGKLPREGGKFRAAPKLFHKTFGQGPDLRFVIHVVDRQKYFRDVMPRQMAHRPQAPSIPHRLLRC